MITAAYVDLLEIHRTPPNPAACPIALNSVDGLAGSPSTKRNSSKRPRGHGSSDSTKFYDDRVLQLRGYCTGATMAALQATRDTLAGALALDGADQVFRFRREGFAEDEQVSFRIAEFNIALSGTRRTMVWTAQFVCSDPRIYSYALKAASYDPTVGAAGTGLVFPLTFALSFAGTGGGSQLVCSNQGNYPTPPLYTISGPVTNPIIDNMTTGQSIYTTGLTLAAGDQLVVDVASKRFTLNGVQREDFVDSSLTVWGELAKGDNLVRLRGTGMTTGQTQLQVNWRDARI